MIFGYNCVFCTHVRSCLKTEPSARELFSEPPPGSVDQLLQCWRAEIFPHVRKALGADTCQETVLKIEQVLSAGQMDEAVTAVRSCVTEDTFATLRMRPLEDFATAEAAAYQSTAAAAKRQVSSQAILQLLGMCRPLL